ncbi:MAG: glycosyltransferase [Desulfobacterales bacterium]|nr:glycosyltransferase [Desulfobacterales bacterium]
MQGRENALKVGYVGHLYKGKGMEIIEKIAPKLPDIDFHIIGGLEEDINYWKARNNYPNLIFHGFIEQGQVSKYINSLDICLLPNQKKVLVGNNINIGDYTSPLKMFDYMAHKKAIIASDLPVLREVLNEENAVLIAPDNVEGWIQAIEKLKDEKLREKLANKAYNDFIEKYTWEKRVQVIIE